MTDIYLHPIYLKEKERADKLEKELFMLNNEHDIVRYERERLGNDIAKVRDCLRQAIKYWGKVVRDQTMYKWKQAANLKD